MNVVSGQEGQFLVGHSTSERVGHSGLRFSLGELGQLLVVGDSVVGDVLHSVLGGD